MQSESFSKVCPDANLFYFHHGKEPSRGWAGVWFSAFAPLPCLVREKQESVWGTWKRLSEEDDDGVGWQQKIWEVEGNMGWRTFLHPPSCAFQEPGKYWGKKKTGTGLAGPWVRKYKSPGVELWKLLVLRSFWVTVMEVLQCCWAVCWKNNPSAFN